MKFSVLAILATLATLAFSHATEGDISVTINGQKLDPQNDDDIKMENITPTGTILVRGLHMQFDIDVATLTLKNYILTGFPNDRRIVAKPTLIFTSKTPTFAPGALNNLLLAQVEVKADSALLQFTFAAGKYKFQINDIADGGALQIEPEMSGSATFVHILGPNVFFYLDPSVKRVLFTDGLGAVSKAQDPINYHEMLLGKDSPEAATQTFQSGTESRWSVLPGGRVGQVMGHDAFESNPSNCTQQCQNSNQIHGSIPIPPNPTDPTPLPDRLPFPDVTPAPLKK